MLTLLIQQLTNTTPRTLFKILNKLPNFGVGRKVTKITWNLEKKEPCYWTIARVAPDKVS